MDRYQLCAVVVVTPEAARAPLPASAATLAERPARLAKAGRGAALAAAARATCSPSRPPPAAPASPRAHAHVPGRIENTIEVSGAACGCASTTTCSSSPRSRPSSSATSPTSAIWHGFDVSVVALERMFQKMRELAPTIIVGPPSFYEVLENRCGRRRPGSAAPPARRRPPRRRPGPAGRPGSGLVARRPWAAMYGPLSAPLMLTGPAPVGPRMVTVFQQLGIPLYEVYGSTEAGWVSSNLPATGSGLQHAGRRDRGRAGWRRRDHRHRPAPQAVGYRFAGEETAASTFLLAGRTAGHRRHRTLHARRVPPAGRPGRQHDRHPVRPQAEPRGHRARGRAARRPPSGRWSCSTTSRAPAVRRLARRPDRPRPGGRRRGPRPGPERHVGRGPTDRRGPPARLRADRRGRPPHPQLQDRPPRRGRARVRRRGSGVGA